MTLHVLLVEDSNLSQSESLLPNLQEHGYHVFTVATPEGITAALQKFWPNLVVFNTNKSSYTLTGFEWDNQQIRLKVPRIIVAGQNYSDIRPDANTLLVAPDKLQQLDQSIKKMISSQQNRFIRLPRLTIDCQEHRVLRGEKCFPLTPKEFRLLYLLVENQEQVLSRKVIMQQVWDTDYLGDTRTLDVHIRWLREKIEDDPSHPRRLITIRGVGYRFVMETEEDGG